MTQYRQLKHASNGDVILSRATWCKSYFCKLRGLQFVRDLPEDEGLIFVNGGESVINSAIHMFFMFFEIGVVWLDSSGKVVDKTLAKPWRPNYAPKEPAQYYVEARPSILEKVAIGDVLTFDEVVG